MTDQDLEEECFINDFRCQNEGERASVEVNEDLEEGPEED